MKHIHVKAPCGHVVEHQFKDEASFKAHLAKLTEDHKPGGPGCHACRPVPVKPEWSGPLDD